MPTPERSDCANIKLSVLSFISSFLFSLLFFEFPSRPVRAPLPTPLSPGIADIDKDGNLIYILCNDPDCNATVTSSIVVATNADGKSAAAPVHAQIPLRGFKFGADGQFE